MNDYAIGVTRLQAQNLTMDVLASSETATFLVRAIGQGIWSLAEIDGGVEKLNRFLAGEGYTLVKGEVPKQKAAKAVGLSDWNNTKRPATKKPGKKASLIQDGDVDLISTTKPRAGSKWPEARESGEAVKVLIAQHSITDHQLMNDYEFDEDEIKLLKDGEYEQIGRRILFELLTDMRKVLDGTVVKEPRKAQPVADSRAPNPNRELGGMTRSQMGEAIGKLLADNPWLTDDELIHNYEFGEKEVVWARAGEWLKFSGAELNSIYKDLTGGIAERAIQIPTTPAGYKA